jgi:hypothetical protein
MNSDNDMPTVRPATGGAPGPADTQTVAGHSAGTAALMLVPLLVGSVIAVSLGVYANVHEPTGISINLAGFSGPLTAKVWLASLGALLAVVQVISALALYGKLGGFSPSWAGTVHRWSGRLALLATLPVAVHCLYAVGFSGFDARTLIHSLLGCFFFGAFAVKMLILPKHDLPGWVLPVLGGLVFTALIGLWLTSSLWYFTTVGVRF